MPLSRHSIAATRRVKMQACREAIDTTLLHQILWAKRLFGSLFIQSDSDIPYERR